jgi:hypothetical protein
LREQKVWAIGLTRSAVRRKLQYDDPASPIVGDPSTRTSMARHFRSIFTQEDPMKRTVIRMFAAAAALGAVIAALPAVAQDAVPSTTGSHIDPSARAQLFDIIRVGGATEAAKAVPLDASEAQVAQRPQIGEIDAADWLPAAPAETHSTQ